MTITETDLSAVQAAIAPLLGQKPWRASLGHGSFITLDFGQKLPPIRKFSPSGKPLSDRGEWHLWIYMCAWRLENNGEVLACCEDPRPKMEAAVQFIQGVTLESVELMRPLWDTTFFFARGITLRTFSIYSEECEHWQLFMSNGNVLVIGPGSDWSCVSASSAN